MSVFILHLAIQAEAMEELVSSANTGTVSPLSTRTVRSLAAPSWPLELTPVMQSITKCSARSMLQFQKEEHGGAAE